MTNQKEIFAAMVTKASSLSVEQLKHAIEEDNTNPQLPDVVFESLLIALESKLPASEFTAFCESL